MDCFSCYISPLSMMMFVVVVVASEQEKLPPAIRVSGAVHCFQNDALKKGWGRMQLVVWWVFEARPHKQCEEEVSVGWEANE
jgi:hypothetical protein